MIMRRTLATTTDTAAVRGAGAGRRACATAPPRRPAASTSRATSWSLVTTTSDPSGRLGVHEPADQVVGDLADREQHPHAPRVGHRRRAWPSWPSKQHVTSAPVRAATPASPSTRRRRCSASVQLAEARLRDVVAVDDQVRPRLAQQLVEQRGVVDGPAARAGTRRARSAPGRRGRPGAPPPAAGRARSAGRSPASTMVSSSSRTRTSASLRAARSSARAAVRSAADARRSSMRRPQVLVGARPRQLGRVERRPGLVGRLPALAARAVGVRPQPPQLALQGRELLVRRAPRPAPRRRSAGAGRPRPGPARARACTCGVRVLAEPAASGDQVAPVRRPEEPRADGGLRRRLAGSRRRPRRCAASSGSSAPTRVPRRRGRRRPAAPSHSGPAPAVARRRGANRCTARSDAGTSAGSAARARRPRPGRAPTAAQPAPRRRRRRSRRTTHAQHPRSPHDVTRPTATPVRVSVGPRPSAASGRRRAQDVGAGTGVRQHDVPVGAGRARRR